MSMHNFSLSWRACVRRDQGSRSTHHEATVSVLRLDIVCCDCVPRVAHPLLDVGFRERALSEYALPPEVEEGIVEGGEALG
jgi:hypothetical protein